MLRILLTAKVRGESITSSCPRRCMQPPGVRYRSDQAAVTTGAPCSLPVSLTALFRDTVLANAPLEDQFFLPNAGPGLRFMLRMVVGLCTQTWHVQPMIQTPLLSAPLC
eukprot:9224290-Pyramimonas_sp.AAC.1